VKWRGAQGRQEGLFFLKKSSKKRFLSPEASLVPTPVPEAQKFFGSFF